MTKMSYHFRALTPLAPMDFTVASEAIMRAFLYHNEIVKEFGGSPAPPNPWPAACIGSGVAAKLAATEGAPSAFESGGNSANINQILMDLKIRKI